MKFKSQQGSRIKYLFVGITTFETGWWFNESKKEWEFKPDMRTGDYSSHQDCNSVRAFRRKIKKCPTGVEFRLVSRWFNHDVYAKNTTKIKII